ncbi:hypothetical protein [Actinoplanes sp. NPDC026670]|uniref:hypothetical protein n=1 Tax=Actinoplanes sp. NPDC026670 TaxID=3154700 RepID=UPI0033CB1A93
MTFHNAGPAHPEPASPDESPAGMKPGAGLTKRRRFLISASVVLTAVTGVAAAHAATAAVSEPPLKQPDSAATSFDAAFWQRQELLVDLRGWTEGLPGIKTSGYVTSINNEPVDGSVVLVWHGPADPVQRQIIDEAGRRHIPISVQQRKYSMADLERAADQIFAIESGTGEFQNFKISGAASFSIDFDGVTVIGQYLHPPAEGIAAADTALTRALTARTGVAVTIEHGELVPH